MAESMGARHQIALMLLGEAEEDTLNRFGDDGALPQAEVDTPWLWVI